tara:strand:+ start:192 stop:752 length:561 start_codon:yes stop_codon:yes gene_type:complete
MATQTTTKTQPIGLGLHDDFPAICIQDYETNNFKWFNVYEIFQNSNDLEEFTELMKKARKSVCRDEWFYSDCQYLHSIYSEHISDETLYEYLESLDDALSNGYSVSLHEEFIGHFGNSYFGELSEYYYGEYDNTKDFAENFVEENYDLDSLPDIITSNIDYENVWYDLQHDFVEIEADRKTYFFRQ